MAPIVGSPVMAPLDRIRAVLAAQALVHHGEHAPLRELMAPRKAPGGFPLEQPYGAGGLPGFAEHIPAAAPSSGFTVPGEQPLGAVAPNPLEALLAAFGTVGAQHEATPPPLNLRTVTSRIPTGLAQQQARPPMTSMAHAAAY